MKKFKRHRDFGLFDADIRIKKLIGLGDPLHRLSQGINFEIFRPTLGSSLSKLAKGAGGRPPYGYLPTGRRDDVQSTHPTTLFQPFG